MAVLELKSITVGPFSPHETSAPSSALGTGPPAQEQTSSRTNASSSRPPPQLQEAAQLRCRSLNSKATRTVRPRPALHCREDGYSTPYQPSVHHGVPRGICSCDVPGRHTPGKGQRISGGRDCGTAMHHIPPPALLTAGTSSRGTCNHPVLVPLWKMSPSTTQAKDTATMGIGERNSLSLELKGATRRWGKATWAMWINCSRKRDAP